MSLNSLGLGFMFTATDLASGVMDKVKNNLESLAEASGKSIEGLDGQLKKFGTGVAAMAIGFGALGGAMNLADKYGEFESAIAAVGAVSGASADELALLKKAALDAGVATQFSPTQATLGLNELAQAGFNAKESVELLRPVLDLAAGSLGQLSPQEAAGLAAQAMKAFGLETWQATAAVDQMLQASNMFAMRADDLPLALGVASRGAQILNQSLTETVIAVGLVKNTIPGTERAATAVAVAMEKMANPKVQKALHGIGVEAVDATGNFRPFLDVLGDMIPALGKMSKAEQGAFLMKTFGAESLGGLQTIMTQVTDGIKTNTGATLKGAEALAYLRSNFMSASGVAKEFSDKLLDTWEGQKKLLAGSVETLAVQLGEPFAKALRPVIEYTIALVNGFLAVFAKMPESVKIGIAVVGLLGAAFVGVSGALIALGALWPLLVTGAGLATTALGALSAAAFGVVLPLLPFILLGALVVGVILALTNNWWGLRDAVVTGSEIIWESITDAFHAVVDFATGIWGTVTSTFNDVVDAVAGAMLQAWDAISSFAVEAFDVLSKPFRWWFNVVAGVVRWEMRLFTALADLLVAVWDYAVAEITQTELWKNIAAGIDVVKQFFSDLIESAVAGWVALVVGVSNALLVIETYVEGVVRDIESTWQLGVDTISDAFNGVVADISSAIDSVWNAMVSFGVQLAEPWQIGFGIVKEIAADAADYVLGLVDQMTSALSSVVDWIGDVSNKVLGFFDAMPEDVHSLAADVRASTPGGGFQSAAATAAPSAQTMPAAAAAEATPRARPAARLNIDYEKLSAAMSKRPINTVVEIDGERVATATASARRSSRARAGVPVSPE